MPSNDNMSDFLDALAARDWDKVCSMLDAGNVREQDHGRALMAAVKDNSLLTTDKLLKLVKVSIVDFWRARNKAAMLGHMSILALLEDTASRLSQEAREGMDKDVLTNSRIQAGRMSRIATRRSINPLRKSRQV